MTHKWPVNYSKCIVLKNSKIQNLKISYKFHHGPQNDPKRLWQRQCTWYKPQNSPLTYSVCAILGFVNKAWSEIVLKTSKWPNFPFRQLKIGHFGVSTTVSDHVIVTNPKMAQKWLKSKLAILGFVSRELSLSQLFWAISGLTLYLVPSKNDMLREIMVTRPLLIPQIFDRDLELYNNALKFFNRTIGDKMK